MSAPISSAIRTLGIHGRKHALAWMGINTDIPPCMVCSKPNRVDHPCSMRAIAQITNRIRKVSPSGMPYRRTLWEGFLFENGGATWRCHHHHENRQEAIECAVARMCLMQRGAGTFVAPFNP